jgi:serine/threonine-protein kinase
VRRDAVTRRTDVFSASVVLWELLTGRKLFRGATDHERMTAVLRGNYPRPSQFEPTIEGSLDRIVMRGLARDPADRFPSALDMAIALERAVPPASQRLVGEWVAAHAAKTLETRSELIYRIETSAIPPARARITPTNFSLAGHSTESAAVSSEPPEGAPIRARLFTRQRALMLSAALALGAALSALSSATRVRTDGSRVAAAEPAPPVNLAQLPSHASAGASGASGDAIPPRGPHAAASAPSGVPRTKSPPSEAVSATSKVPALSSKSRARAKDFMPNEL